MMNYYFLHWENLGVVFLLLSILLLLFSGIMAFLAAREGEDAVERLSKSKSYLAILVAAVVFLLIFLML